jgi:hypothetical protein
MKQSNGKSILYLWWAYIEERPHVILLFLMLILGIMANWFWTLGWEYLRNPESGLSFGTMLEILVRLVLGVIAAALTFVPVYREVTKEGGGSWVAYLLAFQNGFFWEATLDAVVRNFTI